MPSPNQQNDRLTFEKRLVQRYFPEMQWHESGDSIVIEGWCATRKGARRYKAKLVLSSDFPFRSPELLVVEPQSLAMREPGTTLKALGLSHAFHLSHNGSAQGVSICHTGQWDASHTCVNVLSKLILWLEAYETYLQTGKDIAHVLEDLKDGTDSLSLITNVGRAVDVCTRST
jgi:hypothetical protein